MKQVLRRTDTEIRSKFYNYPLIIEGVCEGRFFFFRKFTRSATLIEQTITSITCLLFNKVNGKWTICVSAAAFQRERERERERERSGYDDEKGHGRLWVMSMLFPIIVP